MINVDTLPAIQQIQAERDLSRLVRNHTEVLLSVFEIAPEGTGLISLFGSGMEFTNKEALRVWVRKTLLDHSHYVSLPTLRDMLEKKLMSFSKDWL
ncbi:hypothetical protein SAMN06297280_3437 [Arsukibacterium tuosuense]|uniref:Uncharacterized protein n=1 Tax=Arsukibacterium tuosuense TaxID=1323745 RepID=A0A285JGQ5_9GAMM|nr:hypothetical protein [Arsukibacterium tuosuense]SNY58566.1 hypothetical protein SAMN06297280_3437 [Arsukibacterium tuosuense]